MEIRSSFRRNTMFRKFVSLLVIQSFILSNIAFADSLQTKSTVPQKNQSVLNPDNISIEKEYGLIKSRFLGNSNKLIINIQDAHCNFEAQTNIVNILETLIKSHSLSLISVEGADGLIDTTWFKAFPDEQVREEVAGYFMKKGEITGPEFLSITKNYPIKLFGAENRAYYIQNLNAFTSSYPLKAETEKYYNSIKAALNRLKGYIYSPGLKAMDAKSQDYESKKMQFNDYIRFLQAEAEKQKINLRSYENLFRLVSVLVYEKKIDFSVTDKERSGLIDEISKALSKDALNELVSQSIAFKSGKISSVEFYNYLKKSALDNNIDLSKKYLNLYNYIIYNSVYSKIDNEKLFNDIKTVQTDIKEKLFANDDQRTLDKLSNHIDILIGMVNIKLLNGDFNYYQTHRDEFTHEVFANFIIKEGVKYGLAYDIEPPNEAVAKSIPKLEDFYAIATKRDKALVDNTLAEMDREDQNIAVLVTGGFHSEGMGKLLEKQGVSYIVVCPSITKDVPSPYIQILTNQKTPIEDILASPAVSKKGMLGPFLRAQFVHLTVEERQRVCDDVVREVPLEVRESVAELLAQIMTEVADFSQEFSELDREIWVKQRLSTDSTGEFTRDANVAFKTFAGDIRKSLESWLLEKKKLAERNETERIKIALTYSEITLAGKMAKAVTDAPGFKDKFVSTYTRVKSDRGAGDVGAIRGKGKSEQGAITVGGVELTPAQKLEVNATIREDFRAGEAKLRENVSGFTYKVDIYEIPSLEGLSYLVAHPGRGDDVCDHNMRRIYMSPSRYSWYLTLSTAARKQFVEHEMVHIEHPDWNEARVTQTAPIDLVLKAAQARAQTAAVESKPAAQAGKKSPLLTFREIGEQIWLDGLTLDMLAPNGKFEELVRDHGITGVTTNPSLIKAYLKDQKVLDKAARLASRGLGEEEVYYALIKDLAETVIGVFKKYGVEGKFSVELNPLKADDAEASIKEAMMWTDINPSAMMVKVASNEAGYRIIEEVTARGRNVNATLIFSPEQYKKVAEAYIRGLGHARFAGRDLSKIYSVASFFISRWDVKFAGVIPEEDHGMFANAVAIDAYNSVFKELFGSERFAGLRSSGANVQDFLLASTGSKADVIAKEVAKTQPALAEKTKNQYPPDIYVSPVQGANVVNTLPIGTIDYLMTTNVKPEKTIETNYPAARKVMDTMEAKGVDVKKAGEELFSEGMKSFLKDFADVQATISIVVAQTTAAAPAGTTEPIHWPETGLATNLPGRELFGFISGTGENYTLRGQVEQGGFTTDTDNIAVYKAETVSSSLLMLEPSMPFVCRAVLEFIRDNMGANLYSTSNEPTLGHYVRYLQDRTPRSKEDAILGREAFIDANYLGEIRVTLQVWDRSGAPEATLHVFRQTDDGGIEIPKGKPVDVILGLSAEQLPRPMPGVEQLGLHVMAPEKIEAYNETAKLGLKNTLSEIKSLKETTLIPQDMAVVLAIDTGLDDGTLGVAQMSGRVLKEFLGNDDSVAVVRARGDKLANAVEAEVARLQNLSGGGKRVAVVVNAGAKISPEAEGRLRSIVEKAGPAIAPQGRSALLKIVSVPNRPVSLIGLLDVDLRIAYGRNDDDILGQLARVAVNDANNQPFIKSDLENILSGRLGLRPIMPFNVDKIYEMRSSEEKALHSL